MLNPGQSRRSMVAFLVALLAAGGCGSDTPSSPPPTDFTIAVGSANLSLARGATTTTFVKATRVGGFTGDIVFGIGGGAGVNRGISGTNVPDSMRIDLAAEATAPVGNSNVELTASHPGSATQRLTITVAIIAPASGSLAR